MIDYLFIGMLFFGLAFMLIAGIGVFRFPDVYTRLHAVSKGTTFGFMFVVMGAALLLGNSTDIAKAMLAILFQFMTAPTAAHMIGRVAIKKGLKPVINAKGDFVRVEEALAMGERKANGNRANGSETSTPSH